MKNQIKKPMVSFNKFCQRIFKETLIKQYEKTSKKITYREYYEENKGMYKEWKRTIRSDSLREITRQYKTFKKTMQEMESQNVKKR